ALGRTKALSRSDQAGGADGRPLSVDSGKGVPALPLYAFERIRAAGVIRAPAADAVTGTDDFPARADVDPSAAVLNDRDQGSPAGCALFCGQVLHKCFGSALTGLIPGAPRLPSPSRHIYKSLTIAVAFRR